MYLFKKSDYIDLLKCLKPLRRNTVGDAHITEYRAKMILPKTSSKSELYLQVQNQLRIQNRQLISELLAENQFLQSEKEVSTNNVNSKKFQTQDILIKKSPKKRFENAATNTEN